MQLQTTVDIGALIRSVRKERGLDQAELAKRAGVSRLWIIEVEKGKPRAQVGLVLRTLAALDITLRAERSAQLAIEVPDIDEVVERARRRRRRQERRLGRERGHGRERKPGRRLGSDGKPERRRR